MKSKNEIPDEIKDWKKTIHEYRKEASAQFNKQLVYLSSGGLILTLGFVKDLVDLSSAQGKWMLISTWVCFAGSLILNLISHKSTMKAMDLELDGKCDESDKQDLSTDRLDLFSIVFLLAAISLFVIFISLNLN